MAEKILYGAMDLINQRSGQDSLEVFKQALEAIQTDQHDPLGAGE